MKAFICDHCRAAQAGEPKCSVYFKKIKQCHQFYYFGEAESHVHFALCDRCAQALAKSFRLTDEEMEPLEPQEPVPAARDAETLKKLTPKGNGVKVKIEKA